jgi:hypothetical protein
MSVAGETLGHSSVFMVARYSHPVPERKLQAVEALERYGTKESELTVS